MDLCNTKELDLLLKKHGFSFSKGLGQNFLCDPSVPVKIAENANIDKETCVLEIGPGVGSLTVELCKRAYKVLSIELDKRLYPILNETVGHFDNFSLIEGDVLKTDLKKICKEFEGHKIVACANLPYYITSPAITALLEAGCFDSVTVMVQREVAERISALPGTKEYGAFTLLIKYYSDPSLLFDVGRECFTPQPKVDSAVVRLDFKKNGFLTPNQQEYFRIVRSAFMQRRKTLANCFRSSYGLTKDEASDILSTLGLRPDIRGEALSPEQFANLSELIKTIENRKKGL